MNANTKTRLFDESTTLAFQVSVSKRHSGLGTAF